MIGRTKTTKRKHTKRAITKKSNKKGVSLPIKRYVKTEISKQSEEKIAQFENTQSPVVTSVSGSISYYVENLSIPFNISQGAAQGDRIGNEIILKSFVIRGYFLPVYPAGEVTTLPNGCLLKLYVGYRKDYTPVTPSLTNLFQSGSSSAAPQGNVYDMITPINNDTFKIIYQRSFKLSPVSQSFGTGSETIQNNDFSLVRTFAVDLCKHGLKNRKIKYNDTATQPFDALINNLYLWCVVASYDGTPMPTSGNNESLYYIDFTSTIKFTDI